MSAAINKHKWQHSLCWEQETQHFFCSFPCLWKLDSFFPSNHVYYQHESFILFLPKNFFALLHDFISAWFVYIYVVQLKKIASAPQCNEMSKRECWVCNLHPFPFSACVSRNASLSRYQCMIIALCHCSCNEINRKLHLLVMWSSSQCDVSQLCVKCVWWLKSYILYILFVLTLTFNV